MADFDGLSDALNLRKAQSLYRSRRLLTSAQQPQQQIDGKDVISFCSNDYLGLANHPKVKEAFTKAVELYGVGSGASHLVNGHSALHHELELTLAEFTGRDRAVLFSTGFMANMGSITALVGRGDAVLQDKWNHASLIDAGLASAAKFKRYQHCDLASLERQLLSCSDAGRTLIVTDSVFSMDGDIAPLAELADLADAHNACLMIDDAHGFGVLGTTGAGASEQFQLSQDRLPVLMGTLGKACGTFGAFVAGSEELVETLIQHARSYIYTTALPPAVAAASLASIELIQTEGWRRDRLQQLISQLRAGIERIGFPLMESGTPIQPVLIGDAELALKISGKLEENGLLVTAIRPPTVPDGTSRLRITLSAEHTEAQVGRLLSVLGDVYDQLSTQEREQLSQARTKLLV
ncbi:8-amino-7-oxononanoate synthase [Litoribrevibacter albus]|uniref:8-amino-7-oxononanoate synthase n=1 Tax=Litoribrevibacter albus TaxID=1473156 RepID=A0AA37SFN6_9GAMM|nr:8-amino-7-oxononanoate synthase [Litoribrevibacter albus]GLQ33274.1 8-amino-7-oxononanoate synthase [Litoribrevibacter albus]